MTAPNLARKARVHRALPARDAIAVMRADVGYAVLKRRNANNLTYAQLARMAGVGVEHIQSIENGDGAVPTMALFRVLHALALDFRVTPRR